MKNKFKNISKPCNNTLEGVVYLYPELGFPSRRPFLLPNRNRMQSSAKILPFTHSSKQWPTLTRDFMSVIRNYEKGYKTEYETKYLLNLMRQNFKALGRTEEQIDAIYDRFLSRANLTKTQRA